MWRVITTSDTDSFGPWGEVIGRYSEDEYDKAHTCFLMHRRNSVPCVLVWN